MNKKKEEETIDLPEVRAANLPAEVAEGSWGAVEELDATDLLVPKIFHQQAMSDFVADGKAIPGDFCDSLTGEKLAGKDEGLEVIIFGSYKTMLIRKWDDKANRWDFESIITLTPQNAREWANKPLVEETSEGKFSHQMQYNYYCLLKDKLNDLPYVLTLGSTKTAAAKKLNTMLYRLKQLNKPSAAFSFILRSTPEKNDKGSWFGLEINQGNASTAVEMITAHGWYVKSQSQKFVVVEEEAAAADSLGDEVPF